MTEDDLRDFFTKTCGPINKVVLAGDVIKNFKKILIFYRKKHIKQDLHL